MPKRRTVLGTFPGLVGTAGCLRLAGQGTDTPTATQTDKPTPTPTPSETPTPEGPSTTVSIEVRGPAADWRQFQVDAGNTGTNAETAGPTGDLLEQWSGSGPGGEYVTPAVVDGVVYTARISGGYLQALDLRSGNRRWMTVVEEAVGGPPAVVDGSMVIPFRNGTVRAIDVADGSVRWRTELNHGVRRSAPTVVDGAVYLGATGAVYALDVDTGTIRWSTDTGGDRVVTPAVDFGRVFVSRPDRGLQALRATDGSVDWTYDPGDTVRMAPALYNGILYVGDRAGVLHAVDGADGSAIWTVDTGPSDRFTDADGNRRPIGGSPAVSGDTGTVYLTHYLDGVAAYDASTGDRQGVADVDARIRTEPIVAGEIVYVYGSDGTLRALDAGSLEQRGGTYETLGGGGYPPVATGGLLLLPASNLSAVGTGP